MGPLGVPELIFIFVLALLIFGPKKLPELGRSLGKGMQEFRRASNELKSTFEREMNNLERESESVKEATRTVEHDLKTSNDYMYDDYSYSHDSTASASAPQAAETNPAPNSGESEVKKS